MEILLAVQGKDFVLTATNKATVRGVTVLNQTDDKSRALNQHNLLIFAGESGDTIQFAEYIQANVQLYGMKNDTELNSDAVAAFTRREMADNLRTRVIALPDLFYMAARSCLPVQAYQVLMILAGWNILTKKPALNWIDNLGTRAAVPYAAHGYGAYYTMSIFDRYHRDDISYDEGVDIIRKCIAELEKRLPIASGGYLVKVVDAKGIREVTDIDRPEPVDLMQE